MRSLVCGAGGFIGNWLVSKLSEMDHHVTGVDLKRPDFSFSTADEFMIRDLSIDRDVHNIFHYSKKFDWVFQLAADMGGAGFIFTGEHDADIITNSASININVLRHSKGKVGRVFYSSSACMYPSTIQEEPNHPGLREDMAYPANPDSEYGWEKLFSERLYLSASRNWGTDVRISRFHNIFGPLGTFQGGREKAPAAILRKVALAKDGESIEVWGDGSQTRSFLYISDCIDGILALMNSDFKGPVNIGSEEQVSINELAKIAIDLSGKNLTIKNIDGPLGVRGRNSHNALMKEKTRWTPKVSLKEGMEKTWKWVKEMVK